MAWKGHTFHFQHFKTEEKPNSLVPMLRFMGISPSSSIAAGWHLVPGIL